METIRTHKAGTITAGLALVAYGIMFIVHMFTNVITYEFIFRMWPFILVALGVEILIANKFKDKFVYDKAAIFVIITMAFFAMAMACADICFQHAYMW